MPAVPTLFLAPTAPEARRAAWTHLTSGGALSPLDPPLVFTGASGAAAWRELARAGVARAKTAPRFIRADQFFARFHGANARKRPIRGADRLWVLGGVLRRVAPQLVHLERLAHSRDFLSGLGDWIGALRRVNLSEFPAAQGSDELNLLLRAYDTRLAALGAFDFEAAPTLFRPSAAQNRAFAWPRHLLVDDLLEITPALEIGLQALFERAEVVAATLVCPGGVETENPALGRALAFWRECGAHVVRVGEKTDSARAAARVLGLETTVARPENVHLSAAHTPWDEMNRIAAHIRREVEAGARPDDFALACADLGGYEALARHAFAAHGVPLDWPLQPSLRRSPLVRGLLRAARSCRQSWNVHELHDLFGDGTLRLQSEALTFDARRLRAAGRAARHPELDDLEATRAAFEAKIAQFTRHPKNDDALRRAAIEAALAGGDLELVAEFATLCAAFSTSLSARAWQSRQFDLIERLAGHWLESEGEAALAAQNSIVRFKEAAERVVERAQNWSDEDAESQRPAAEWMEWLEWEIDAAPMETAREEWGGGVRVGSASAPPSARAVFFCGWNEGVWPLATSHGPLGARGRDIGAALRAGEASPIARSAHVLARAIGENKAVFLSYAAHIEGAETPPSPLLDDLRAAWPDASWPSLPPVEAQASTRRAHLTRWNRFLGSAHHDDAPAHLQTLAKMRAQRRATENLGVYDGVLGARGQVLMESWLQSRGGAPLSPSALEMVARCPVRYFFERILGVGTEEEGDDDLDARTAGTLVHQIARDWVGEWKTPLGAEDFEPARERLGEIARRECEKLPLRPILREAEWHRLMGADGQSGPLVRWLRMEIAGGGGAWARDMRPLGCSEVRIEGLHGLEQRFEIEIGGETIKGVIDRLDVSADGSQIAVLDYKTGDLSGLPSWKSGDSGLHFQLAIYALAARQLTRRMEPAPQLAMAYISLRRARVARGIGQEGTLGKGCVGALSLSDAAFEAWLDDVSARVARLADLRRVGVFNISLQSAADAKCANCGCKSLCGQHQPTQAARLEELRASPFFYAPQVREWESTVID
ncbi:MAG: PD-(D/E)XK nuclease family protein [Armatimonadetes bacterium]|nr:PD-(D/E)XK nuclease family protein [Armatimonadota bacterium]